MAIYQRMEGRDGLYVVHVETEERYYYETDACETPDEASQRAREWLDWRQSVPQ